VSFTSFITSLFNINIYLSSNSELKQTLTAPVTHTHRRKTFSSSDTSKFINYFHFFSTPSVFLSPAKLKSIIFNDETTHPFVYIKSYLIGTGKLFAERCSSVLQQTDELSRDHPSNLQSFEYQLLIDCLALLSECAHQCHLDQLAARYALETLKILSTIGEDNIHEKKIANG
jgi:hypothetical protein